MSEGGLDFRDLNNHNNAPLMKIDFALISNEDKLCVRVLKAKYKWEGLSRKQFSSLIVLDFGKGSVKFGLIYVAGFVGRFGMGGA
ncbi:hypothetical protein V6N12_028113 [Hibiscus sabdariffa]|uniref:Uncharacterized protein n=1 Tax=Hibiscus sabdariffa TaxID=183260 RepID=A0ABR2F4U8_9ROSI